MARYTIRHEKRRNNARVRVLLARGEEENIPEPGPIDWWMIC
jgi:hypothetical protein